MTLATVRADLAALIRAGVSQTVIVYAYPAESIVLPAVVIVPADPWWTPGRLTDRTSTRVRVQFDVQLIVPRTEVEVGIGDLEALAIVVGLIITPTGWRWQDLSSPEPIEVGDIPAIKASYRLTTTV